MATHSLANKIEDNWNKIEGELKKYWKKLTNDDVESVEGSYDKLSQKLTQAYGYTAEEVEENIKKFSEKLNLDEINEDAESLGNKICGALQNLMDKFKDNKDEWQAEAYSFVKKNLLISITTAALIGAVTARFFRKK